MQPLAVTSMVIGKLQAFVYGVSDFHRDDYTLMQRTDGSWFVDGQYTMHDLLVRLDRSQLVRDVEVDTVAGLVLQQTGRIPVAGDHIAWMGMHIKVADMDGARIDKVIVREEGQGSQTRSTRLWWSGRDSKTSLARQTLDPYDLLRLHGYHVHRCACLLQLLVIAHACEEETLGAGRAARTVAGLHFPHNAVNLLTAAQLEATVLVGILAYVREVHVMMSAPEK